MGKENLSAILGSYVKPYNSVTFPEGKDKKNKNKKQTDLIRLLDWTEVGGKQQRAEG